MKVCDASLRFINYLRMDNPFIIEITTMTESDKVKPLQWQCRRGMLELDVILQPFLTEHFNNISEPLQQAFTELLKQADPDLYTWIMGFGQCEQDEFLEIIQLIRQKMSIA